MEHSSMYEKLRESAERKIMEKRKGKIRAILGYSICSVSVGAKDVLGVLQETLVDTNLENVIVETTGCKGFCSKEPLLEIVNLDGRRYIYELVTPEKARAILISHALWNEAMDEFLLKE